MPINKTVVISCAGIGSRLGLGQTKALLDIRGKPIIRWQLEQLSNVEDIRIVVGYQANEVIKEVQKIRQDVVFVYNHKYFETKTGTSFYLGSRFANRYVLGIDGDMLIHPEDMQKCLEADFEFAAYSDVSSHETVFVDVNEQGDVVRFSREGGAYEWTGPVSLKRENIHDTQENVYNQIEPYLPLRGMYVRAQDIDTYEDYERALEFVRSW